MKVTLEKEQENVVKLDITIPAKDAVDAYNKAVQRISQYVASRISDDGTHPESL